MKKPKEVKSRFDAVHLDEKKNGGFVDVTLWLNHDSEILARAELRMWFDREDMDISTLRKAAIQHAQKICSAMGQYSGTEVEIKVPEDFWRAQL